MKNVEELILWFRAWSLHRKYDISDEKIKDYLYFSQAYHLEDFGIALFSEEIRIVSGNLSIDGFNESIKKEWYSFDFDDFKDLNHFLITVWNTFSKSDDEAMKETMKKELEIYKNLLHGKDGIIKKHVMKNVYFFRSML